MEQISAQSEFWDDQTQAQKTLQELNDLKEHLEQYSRWQMSLADTRAVFELLELETDEALLQEADFCLTQ